VPSIIYKGKITTRDNKTKEERSKQLKLNLMAKIKLKNPNLPLLKAHLEGKRYVGNQGPVKLTNDMFMLLFVLWSW
jgi:hypothetical protein